MKREKTSRAEEEEEEPYGDPAETIISQTR